MLSFGAAIRATLGNRPFRHLIGLYALSWTTAAVIAADLVYFANYYLKGPEQANYFVLVAQGAALLFVPLWVWLSKRMDKGPVFIIGCFSWLVILLAISGWLRTRSPGLPAGSPIRGRHRQRLCPAWSMIPDVVDYDQLKTGQRRRRILLRLCRFLSKMATGAAIWLMGQRWPGHYINPHCRRSVPVQPDQAVQAIACSWGRGVFCFCLCYLPGAILSPGKTAADERTTCR